MLYLYVHVLKALACLSVFTLHLFAKVFPTSLTRISASHFILSNQISTLIIDKHHSWVSVCDMSLFLSCKHLKRSILPLCLLASHSNTITCKYTLKPSDRNSGVIPLWWRTYLHLFTVDHFSVYLSNWYLLCAPCWASHCRLKGKPQDSLFSILLWSQGAWGVNWDINSKSE